MNLLHPAMLPAALRRQLAAAWPGLIQAVQARWYLTVGLCLILTSAGLRFYGLTEHGLRWDELSLSRMTDGSFAEIIPLTRDGHSASILYPMVLWAIQKIDISFFTIRVIPAAAGVLTTASLLFLLPRAGLNRRAAWLAALLSTLSTQMVWHSQDAREYGIDALLVTLLVAGLLGYWRDRRKLLLGVALFLAPLLQYGLVLFGAAVLGLALIYQPFRGHTCDSASTPPDYRSRLHSWLQPRRGLVGPAAGFLAGGALSYGVTARYHLENEKLFRGGYLEDFFFQGEYSLVSFADFAVAQTWELLNYFLPASVALGMLGGLALFLLGSGAGWLISRRRAQAGAAPEEGGESRRSAPKSSAAVVDRADFERLSGNALIALFLLAGGIGVVAAILNWYPFGYTRQAIYLGPAVFLAAGVLLHRVADYASGWFPGRNMVAAALFLAVSGLLIGLGAADLQQRERRPAMLPNYAGIISFLQENVRSEDVVVSNATPLHALEFQSGALPDNYYRMFGCVKSADDQPSKCIRYAVNAGVDVPDKLWFIFLTHFPAPAEFAKWNEHTQAQVMVTELNGQQLHLITNLEAGWSERYQHIVSGEPAARSVFEVYLDDNKLHYAKEPCAPSDTADTFLLHLIPADVGYLPEWRRGYDFDNLDFQFDETYLDREVYAARFDGKCLASVALPDYPISEIRTGQLRPDGSALWRANLAPNPELVQQVSEKRLLDYQLDYRAVVSGPSAARAVFAMYLDGQTLHYAKEPCAPADTEAAFLLHLIPQDADDLPERGNSRFYGFENRDFTFTDHGAEFGGACLASVPLPDYPLAVIRTGQYRPDGQRLWLAEFPAGR